MTYQHPKQIQQTVQHIKDQLSNEPPEETSFALQPQPHISFAMQKNDSLEDQLVWLSDLTTEQYQVNWLWEGYIAFGEITLLSAFAKMGKTTLYTHLLKAIENNQQFLNLDTEPVKTLIVTEESKTTWQSRKENLELEATKTGLISRPFHSCPTHDQWRDTITEIRTLCQKHQIKLVVVDTIASLWPAENENDSREVTKSLQPLHQLTSNNIAVLLVHHTRKTEGKGGRATRGSGALTAFVDFVLEIEDGNSGQNKRVIKAQSRYEDTPKELVIELTEDGYTALGTHDQIKKNDQIKLITDHLPKEPESTTLRKVLNTLKIKNVLIDYSTLHRWAQKALNTGMAKIVGKSTDKGTPDLWAKPKESQGDQTVEEAANAIYQGYTSSSNDKQLEI